MKDDHKQRCFGSGPGKEAYADYHDKEWGIPVHDDRHLFEMLILEGAQAGLSWETVLKKRQDYRLLFHNFDPEAVAEMTDEEFKSYILHFAGLFSEYENMIDWGDNTNSGESSSTKQQNRNSTEKNQKLNSI